jgi:hypothetical protein
MGRHPQSFETTAAKLCIPDSKLSRINLLSSAARRSRPRPCPRQGVQARRVGQINSAAKRQHIKGWKDRKKEGAAAADPVWKAWKLSVTRPWPFAFPGCPVLASFLIQGWETAIPSCIEWPEGVCLVVYVQCSQRRPTGSGPRRPRWQAPQVTGTPELSIAATYFAYYQLSFFCCFDQR